MTIERDVLALLDQALCLGGRAQSFTATTALLGALPELDSLAMTHLITGIEERFGFIVADDEIDGSVFASVGSLTAFVMTRLPARITE